MLNTAKLKGKLIEKGVTVAEISKILGIAPSTFYRKMSNNSFQICEADMIVVSLSLSPEESQNIFFAQLSHKCDII